MVESKGSGAYDVAEEINRIQEDAVVAETVKFLGNKEPMQVRVTTSQQIVNMNDHKDVALVFDMRSEKQYAQCSLDKSVNLPIEKFSEDCFINWEKSKAKLEADTSILKTKY